MIDEVKDSIANGTTVAAAGAAIVDWTSMLTMALIITGIVLNILRIVDIRRKKKED